MSSVQKVYSLEELKQILAEDVPLVEYQELIEFLRNEMEYRCPKCGCKELTALVPSYMQFKVVGRRVDGKIQVDSAGTGFCDHPNQDEQRVVCNDCGHEWVETREVLDWDFLPDSE